MDVSYRKRVMSFSLLLGAEDGVDGCAANRALATKSGLAILHSDALCILEFLFLLAFHAIVRICHDVKHLLVTTNKHS